MDLSETCPDEIVKNQIEECRYAHSGDAPYYDLVENEVEAQWNKHIHRFTGLLDLTVVLELSPGHGRNSNKLKHYAKELHLVDVNATCIEACQKRFENDGGKCRFFFYVNDGKSFPMIPNDFISAIFTWDSMVHFDKRVCQLYIKEFARVLRPGGRGFVHHSNYGHVAPDDDWMNHLGWRSNMTKELFAEYALEAGLKVLTQEVIDWSARDMDCITLIEKPCSL